MLAITLALIAVGFVLSCPLTAWFGAWGRRRGWVEPPGPRRLHREPVAVTGGMAIFCAIVLPMGVGLVAAVTIPGPWWEANVPAAAPHIAGVVAMTPMAISLIACLIALHVMGLVDDRRDLGPGLKLGVEVAVAALMVVAFDVRLMDLDAVRDTVGPWPSIALTIVWLVAITNAFNFLDNMDGLCAGVAAICGGLFLATALLGEQWFVASVLALSIGAVLGFAIFNLPPARIFMGDAGSLPLGFLVGLCAVRVTYYDAEGSGGWWAVATPVVILAIPLYDLVSVTVIRLAQGRSPFRADTQHFSHRLVRRGLSQRNAVMVVWACTLAAGAGGVLLARLPGWGAALVLIQCAAVLLALALLERTSQQRREIP
ncbi:MAG: undecaprenyl/decaprenyl-phosphate alpha-N-acetylglucosaminyl 1-phosphate transferase [Phycisphaerae bacterium]|nr:undecaprenyl/decaprenyl-phosphate alpha-N-acetylglucosaminyl 1-phosphate transferase [Phycisphaerae bacterium]